MNHVILEQALATSRSVRPEVIDRRTRRIEVEDVGRVKEITPPSPQRGAGVEGRHLRRAMIEDRDRVLGALEFYHGLGGAVAIDSEIRMSAHGVLDLAEVI